MGTAMTAAWSRELIEESGTDQISKPDLKQRFLVWFDSQPEISRVRPYSMIELERALGVPGRVLGPVLMSLGWTRHRRWSGSGPFARFWLPPSN
jgi:hypothetical protein